VVCEVADVVPWPAVGDVLVKFRYRERDLADALRLRMPLLRSRVECVALAGLCVVAALLAGAVAPPGPALSLVRLVLGVCGVGFALAAGALFVVPKLILRRSENLRGPISVDASDEGVTYTRGDASGTIRWDDARVELDRRICALYHGEDVLLVPLRAFRSAQRRRVFLDLVAKLAPREA
jgi:hypothetical protein